MAIADAELAAITEIARLLDDGFAHYVATGLPGKNAEGSIALAFNTTHDRRGGDPLRLVEVGVYSYALGPSRWHYFGSTAEALQAVQRWHAAELATPTTDEP